MKSHVCLTLFVLFLLNSYAYCQTEEVLKLVPRNSLGFAVINQIGQTSSHVTNLGKKAKAPLPVDLLGEVKKVLDITAGLDEGGSAGVVVLPSNSETLPQPEMVFFLPVTDYRVFLNGMGVKTIGESITEVRLSNEQRVLVAKRGKFALLAAENHRVALQSVQTADGSGGQMEVLDKQFKESDIAGVLMRSGIEFLGSSGSQSIRLLKGLVGPKEEHSLQRVDDFLKVIEKNVDIAGFGVRLNANGNLQFSVRARFVKSSAFAETAGAVVAPRGGYLAGLPNDPFIMALDVTNPKETRQLLVQMAQMNLTANPEVQLTATEKAKVEKIIKVMYEDVEGISLTWGVPKIGEPLMGSNFVALIHARKAKNYFKKYVVAFRDMQNVVGNANTRVPFKYTIRELNKKGIDIVELGTEYHSTAVALPEEVKQFRKTFFGEEGKMRFCLAEVDGNAIVMTTLPAERFFDWLAKYKAHKMELNGRPEVRELLEKLPKGSQWVFLVNPNQMLAMAARLASMSPQVLPEIAPAGVGVRVLPTGLEADVILPIAVIELGGYLRKQRERGEASRR